MSFVIGHRDKDGVCIPTKLTSLVGTFSSREAAEARIHTNAWRIPGVLRDSYGVYEDPDPSPGNKESDAPEAPYYKALTPEPIDVIDAWGLNFHLGSALAYIARAGRKPGNELASDLRKAVTYLERAIAASEGRRAWK